VALEIERKYLVDLAVLKALPEWRTRSWLQVRQGFIHSKPNLSGAVTRVRRTDDSSNVKKAFLTVKAATEELMVRQEFEYAIPVADADALLDLCESVIEKERSLIELEGRVWEVDVFQGVNTGLVVAEIELKSVGDEFTVPDWAFKEVTKDTRYLNSNLALVPFCMWGMKNG
jgi:adenylate cyclase